MPKPRPGSGFVEAQSDNLPKIDSLTVFSFLGNNTDFIGAEMKNVKTTRSGRENYGDNAIGYVEIKRSNGISVIRGKVTPEHSIRKKPYSVEVICDENKEEIISVQCEDCAASLGGCKHSVAFIMWLHRRSEEKSKTDVDCYWKRSTMSEIGTSMKFLKVTDMGKQASASQSSSDCNFLEAVIQKSIGAGRCDTQLTKYYKKFNNVERLSIHYLLEDYFQTTPPEEINGDSFLQYCTAHMTENVCSEAAAATVDQADSALWHELRYCRVTASKVYDVAHCRKTAGTLVESILGARKLKDTASMKRGRKLEKEVVKVVEKNINCKVLRCGLMLNPESPIVGASPDGLTYDSVVEVKCPSSGKAMSRYVLGNGNVAAKYYAQVQAQMHFCKKEKGIFCVADPKFENTQLVTIITVDYSEQFCKDIIKKCTDFWKESIFPVLASNYV